MAINSPKIAVSTKWFFINTSFSNLPKSNKSHKHLKHSPSNIVCDIFPIAVKVDTANNMAGFATEEINKYALFLLRSAQFGSQYEHEPTWKLLRQCSRVQLLPSAQCEASFLGKSSGSGRPIKQENLLAKTGSITSKCSIILGESMVSAGCCHPLSLRWQQNQGQGVHRP